MFTHWEQKLFPDSTVARLTLFVVVAYLTYSVGAFSRQAFFSLMLDKRPARGNGGSSAQESYLQELVNARSALVEAFGKDAVTKVFDAHGLTKALERRKGNLAELRRRQEPRPIIPRCTRPVNNTRMEFMYCKSWLSSHRSAHSTEYFEYQINVVCGLVVPFATILMLVGVWLYLHFSPMSWYVSVAVGDLIVRGVLASILGQYLVLKGSARALQRDENFDTIRNFFFHHWMAQSDPPPAAQAAEAATASG